MCVIIYKPQGVKLDPQLIENAIDNNKDGWGFIRRTADSTLDVARGMIEQREEALAYLAAYQDDELAFHARIGTAGMKDLSNTHPFPIGPNAWLMHNGMLGIKGGEGEDHKSDTWVFSEWLEKALGGDHTQLTSLAVGGLLELYARAEHSKFLIMTPERTRIFNMNAGTFRDDCWFSNHTAFTRSWSKGGYCGDYAGLKEWWETNDDMPPKISTGLADATAGEEDKPSLVTVDDYIEFFLLLDLSDIGKLPYEEPEVVAKVLADRHEEYKGLDAEEEVCQDPERAARALLEVLDKYEYAETYSSLIS